MTPRPEDAVKSLQEAVRAAKKERDDAIEAAERKYWRTIAELKGRYRGAQTDIAEVLGITRDYILKQVKKYTSDKPSKK
ncbi:hypothetical protein [Streptomyces mirabilis]|uniref:hypothetical protein n=1 Tax=Streptomyces mirabilis TaxID=68239 RepID=UPI00368D3483